MKTQHGNARRFSFAWQQVMMWSSALSSVEFMNALHSALLGVPGPLAYVLVGLLVFAEAALLVGFVLPGETAVFLGGVLAASGVISLPALVVVVVAAAIGGDAVGYLVGRHFGPQLMRLPMLRRQTDRLAGAQERLRERGGWAVFFGRFTAFLRAVMPSIAGISHMPWRRFLLFNSLGGLIWGAGVALLGYGAGNSYEQAAVWLGRSSIAALTIFVVVVLVLWRRHRRHRSGTTGHTSGDDDPANATPRDLTSIAGRRK